MKDYTYLDSVHIHKLLVSTFLITGISAYPFFFQRKFVTALNKTFFLLSKGEYFFSQILFTKIIDCNFPVIFFSLPTSEEGLFKAHLVFPKEYPLRPPKMTFKSEIWHPNSK